MSACCILPALPSLTDCTLPCRTHPFNTPLHTHKCTPQTASFLFKPGGGANSALLEPLVRILSLGYSSAAVTNYVQAVSSTSECWWAAGRGGAGREHIAVHLCYSQLASNGQRATGNNSIP